jgi:hypothetical protein
MEFVTIFFGMIRPVGPAQRPSANGEVAVSSNHQLDKQQTPDVSYRSADASRSIPVPYAQHGRAIVYLDLHRASSPQKPQQSNHISPPSFLFCEAKTHTAVHSRMS